MNDVTVCIPTIPPRSHLLARAVTSVLNQTHQVEGLTIAVDTRREGAGPTRTRALHQVKTTWVAFLDDDDEFLQQHIKTLLQHAHVTEADIVWPWFQIAGGSGNPIKHARGRQYDPDHPHTFPVTTLVRNELAQQCEFPPPVGTEHSGDDDAFHRQLAALGAKFSHVNVITWLWHHDSGNTAGLPTRW